MDRSQSTSEELSPKAEKDDRPVRFQYSLRALFLFLLVCAAVLSAIQWFGLLFFLRVVEIACHLPLGWLLVPLGVAGMCLAIITAFCRRTGLLIRGRFPFVLLTVLLVLSLATAFYTAWARYRAVFQLHQIDESHAYLYPDQALIRLERSLSAQYPAPPGYFKYHGEWPRLVFYLDAAVLVLAVVTGICVGVLLAPRLRSPWNIAGDDSRANRRRSRLRLIMATLLLASVVWLGVKMERTRREWAGQAEWAERGACACYRDGRLVELCFNITTLDMHTFENPDLADDDLRQLESLVDLEDVGISNSRVTDAGLIHLKNLPRLTSLGLADTQISDAGLLYLKGLPQLTSLDLSGTQVSDAGLRHLSELGNLERLHLARTRITDAGLAHLGRLTRLRWLDLQDTQITDAGLSHFTAITSLDTLYLDRTRVTDAGLRDLRQLPNLDWLSMNGTSVTEAGVAEFLNARLVRHVYFDRPARGAAPGETAGSAK